MIARATLALVALALGAARAQPSSIWVDVSPNTEDPEPEEVEKRYTPELVQMLQYARDDAQTLYTDYQGMAAVELKQYLKNISGLTNETVSKLDLAVLSANETCRGKFDDRLSKIVYDAHIAASFSAENHHKYFLGHMIVFRMHLNKSEDYIRKCDKITQACGSRCETTPRMKRWRRLAAEEIHRVRDDIQHSRRSYRDLLAHAHRRLRTLRRHAMIKARDAVEKLHVCVKEG